MHISNTMEERINMSNSPENKLIKKIFVKGEIECLTGMHIGGTKENLEIGGLDSPVIRDPFTRYPYIPGSSIKGKLRSLMEWKEGKAGETPCNCGNPDCKVCRIFGSSAEKRNYGPTRVIVRDAFPTEETVTSWKEKIKIGMTEVKTENSIDRITSRANPRSIERVVAGSKFSFEVIFSVYEVEKDKENDLDYFKYLMECFKLLEDDGLGGSVSRGYGKIAFRNINISTKTIEHYTGKESEVFHQSFNSIDELLEKIDTLNL